MVPSIGGRSGRDFLFGYFLCDFPFENFLFGDFLFGEGTQWNA
jgi:hypothetical protein